MTRHVLDQPRAAGGGRLRAFLSIARDGRGPHPASRSLWRQREAGDAARRLPVYLRITGIEARARPVG
ncbi:hypothetical protein C2I36_11745 [Rhodobacteraceae bacterium WD3A24]|nr:hypothetical protein C2I36_11745 [Rhodobacteraceae bacterium WD3A24]